MSNQQTSEHCLIVEGNYLDESDAEHALRDPFIEEWVEQTGKFRIHNFDDNKKSTKIFFSENNVDFQFNELIEIFNRVWQRNSIDFILKSKYYSMIIISSMSI